MVVLGADLSMKRSALVWLGGDFKVLRQAVFPIQQGPKLHLRAMRALAARMRHLIPTLCVVENNDHFPKLRPLHHAMCMACDSLDIPYDSRTATSMKLYITGRGRAEKEDVAAVLKDKWKIEFEGDTGYDLSDAAACAVWGVNHLRGGK